MWYVVGGGGLLFLVSGVVSVGWIYWGCFWFVGLGFVWVFGLGC